MTNFGTWPLYPLLAERARDLSSLLGCWLTDDAAESMVPSELEAKMFKLRGDTSNLTCCWKPICI